jgi:hypothetical protein
MLGPAEKILFPIGKILFPVEKILLPVEKILFSGNAGAATPVPIMPIL